MSVRVFGERARGVLVLRTAAPLILAQPNSYNPASENFLGMGALKIPIRDRCLTRIHTRFTQDSHRIHTGFTQDSHKIHTGFAADSQQIRSRFALIRADFRRGQTILPIRGGSNLNGLQNFSIEFFYTPGRSGALWGA